MKTVRTSVRMVVVAMIFLCANQVPTFGQGNVGTIIGHVSDQSGGVILGATVSLLNPATNERRTVDTNDQGDYVFNSVRPATYTLSAEFKGFKMAHRDNVILQVAEKVSVNFTLEPGEITQVVDVTGESPLLQPASSSLGSVISEQTIVQLPLEGRNVYELVTLVPGATTSFNYGARQIADSSVRLCECDLLARWRAQRENDRTCDPCRWGASRGIPSLTPQDSLRS